MKSNIDWLNRVCKWRSWFAGWQLGTRAKGDPESDAVRDHREITILLRAECSAIARVLIEKKIVTVEEFTDIVNDECHALCLMYERAYPGVEATDYGLNMDTKMALETMKRMNFKP